MQLDLSGHHVEVTACTARLRHQEIRAHLTALRAAHRRALRAHRRKTAATRPRPRSCCAEARSTPTRPRRNMYAAIDALVDKLDRCVKKHKEKAADHHADDVIKAPSCRSDNPGARVSMRLIIVSGLSGSGKSVALHMLEDLDFYCVDNIPAALLKSFISHTVRGQGDTYPQNRGRTRRAQPAQRNRDHSGAGGRTAAQRHRLRGHLPARRRRSAAEALRRDPPQAPAWSPAT